MIELLLLTPATRVDEVSDLLMELDALAVTVEDARLLARLLAGLQS